MDLIFYGCGLQRLVSFLTVIGVLGWSINFAALLVDIKLPFISC
jgi:hypothetical protein